jgi:hypothetical protein
MNRDHRRVDWSWDLSPENRLRRSAKEREELISLDDVMDVRILLNVTKTVDEFLENI